MKKAICLCGGFGSRMMPSTRVINKHLLPIYSSFDGAVPMIYYPINVLVNSGITDILIITSDEAAGLMVETLGNGSKFGEHVSFTYKIQNMHDNNNPVGIAGALKLAQTFVGNGNEPFAVILGDNFYAESFKDEFYEFATMAKSPTTPLAYGHVFLKEVYDPQRFGVATIKDGKVVKIIEKPREPESNYAVTGLYLYTPHVFNLLPNLTISDRGELEVSDINQWYVANERMSSTILKDFWHDMGTPESMIRTQEFINKTNFRLDFK